MRGVRLVRLEGVSLGVRLEGVSLVRLEVDCLGVRVRLVR